MYKVGAKRICRKSSDPGAAWIFATESALVIPMSLEQKIEFCDTLKGQKNVLLRTCTPTRERPLSIPKASGKLYLDKVKGLLSENDYVEMSRDFVSERDRLERVIAEGENNWLRWRTKLQQGITAGKSLSNIPT